MTPSPPAPGADHTGVLAVLASSAILKCELLPWGSNYTYLVELAGQGLVELAGERKPLRAIYKPGKGERPLWDFPSGTLYRRERAAYLASEALGWGLVPPTVVRQGPHGPGSVQLYIDLIETENYFTLRERRLEEIWPMAAFDLVANNADRKAGHCLLDHAGHIWAIDHGLTFHALPKLRTVMWEFCGQPIPGHLLADLAGLLEQCQAPGGLTESLLEVLDKEEVQAFRRRLEELLRRPLFPVLDPRQVPWPLV